MLPQSLCVLQACVLKKRSMKYSGSRSLPQILVVLILLFFFFHNKKWNFSWLVTIDNTASACSRWSLAYLVQQLLNCVLIQRSSVMFWIKSKNHLLFSLDKQYTAPKTLLVPLSLFLTNSKDQHTNSINQTQPFNPLVCKPENINSPNTLTAPR